MSQRVDGLSIRRGFIDELKRPYNETRRLLSEELLEQAKRETQRCQHGRFIGSVCVQCFELALPELEATRELLRRLRTVPAERLWDVDA